MLLVAADPEHDEHRTGLWHPEGPARIHAALDGLRAAGLWDAVKRAPVRRATDEEILRVHAPGYLVRLAQFCEAGGGEWDPDTILSAGSLETARAAAGAVLSVIDGLAAGEAEVGLVAARPPGHHALADQAMGFCLLNNVAIGAASLAAAGERVLVVDWDVHHGNGTQAAFWDDPRVLYASTHQGGLFPGTGHAFEIGGVGAPGLTVNVPLPAGATGDVMLMAFDDVFAPEVEQFAPTWVLVSAGFDAHRADPLADLALSAGDFADLARRARQFAPGPGRLVLVLEGGYHLEALAWSVGAALSALLGTGYRPEEATSEGPGGRAVAAAQVARVESGATPSFPPWGPRG